MPRALTNVEKSKLLNELALMPGVEARRIKRTTDRGVMLDEEHERDIQRARLAQMPWTRPAMAVLYIFMALNTWSGMGERSGVWLYIACAVAVILTLGAGYFIRQWWVMRRLRKQLDSIG